MIQGSTTPTLAATDLHVRHPRQTRDALRDVDLGSRPARSWPWSAPTAPASPPCSGAGARHFAPPWPGGARRGRGVAMAPPPLRTPGRAPAAGAALPRRAHGRGPGRCRPPPPPPVAGVALARGPPRDRRGGGLDGSRGPARPGGHDPLGWRAAPRLAGHGAGPGRTDPAARRARGQPRSATALGGAGAAQAAQRGARHHSRRRPPRPRGSGVAGASGRRRAARPAVRLRAAGRGDLARHAARRLRRARRGAERRRRSLPARAGPRRSRRPM